MDKLVSDGQSPLAIGLLMQSGFRFAENSGPKTHFLAVLKELYLMGHDVSLLALQSRREVIELRHAQPRPEKKELGFSGWKLFKFLESGIRFVQGRFNLPYLGLLDSFRFMEACLNHLSHCDIFYERYSMMSLGGVWAAKKLSIPLILEVHADITNVEMPLHNKPLKGIQRYFANLITRQCLEQASKIVAVSKAVSECLQMHWEISADKITVISLGADLELFDPTIEYPETRGKLGLDDEPIVVFTGSFQPWHGLDNLIEAFSRVVLEIPRAKLVLVGDGQTRASIEAQVQRLGLVDRVIFTGSIPYQQVPSVLSIADVAVAPYPDLPSELWFSPLKIFEYMASAKAIVASNAGQIAEILKDDYSGLLIAPGNVGDLSEAIVKLLRNRKLRLRLGENARKEALESHSWTFHTNELERVYRSVLAMRHLST